MYIHAQLDNGVCNGYGMLKEIVDSPNVVYLANGWDEDLRWRKYENGVWSAEKFPPAPPAPPVDEITPLKQQMSEILLTLVNNNLM